ncbi:PREDICTED: uncharacterized protein LOC104804968 [Tarenaya hassleriana]|uniref:uncharacterized protein LOC104804968 n=1 Tax=Tarenaya hassleriana TaxID=28532 RepID=UPI00053C9920|nr:PREDICTED: uncharacterized protein LOC104804968 [Tarenaya hassleriana]
MATSSSASMAMAEKISWYSAVFAAVMLVMNCCDVAEIETVDFPDQTRSRPLMEAGSSSSSRPCDEIYVVKEGETLQTISEKCGDPYIVEENPHIHDPDDVFPGLVIKITSFKPKLH